jgi:uncharacterized protein
MEKVELKFMRITYSHTHAGAYALILSETNGDRRLPIIIGGVEAQAIAIQVENIKPARPLTHDLFKHMCEKLRARMKEVVINDLVEGIFHAKLVLEMMNGEEVEVDARSSDAIALAMRFECPINTYEFIMSAAGLKVEDGDEDKVLPKGTDKFEKSERKSVKSVTLEELRAMLEDYERASKLRDELKRREGTN